jgi:carboxyl-terminal processing protease
VVTVDDVESLWEINLKLREVFRFFEKHLPPQKGHARHRVRGRERRPLHLDPHSVLLKPEAFAEMKTSTKGEFGGLGIVISVRDGKLTVMNPLDNTPASRAGLRSGDVISRIGEVSTVSMPIDEAVRLLRGPGGLEGHHLGASARAGPRPVSSCSCARSSRSSRGERACSTRTSATSRSRTSSRTPAKIWRTSSTALQGRQQGGKLRGVVLDLRNNPGGLLEQAIRVSDKFLTSGDIVTTVGYGNKLREPKRARWSGTESELPLAVLVNNGSASASEIVAGALKNLDRAVVIGERSFGKGSVQVLYDFADNSALKLTIAQYLTPGGISIQNVGVTPDLALKPAVLAKDGVRLYYEPDQHREASLDKHLDRAGASRSWTVTTRIPRDAASRSDLVTLTLTSERGTLTDRPQLPVVTPLRGPPAVRLSVHLRGRRARRRRRPPWRW